jgi:hypothetical protein
VPQAVRSKDEELFAALHDTSIAKNAKEVQTIALSANYRGKPTRLGTYAIRAPLPLLCKQATVVQTITELRQSA